MSAFFESLTQTSGQIKVVHLISQPRVRSFVQMAAMKALLLFFFALSLLHICAPMSARRLSQTSAYGEINNEKETQFTISSKEDAEILGHNEQHNSQQSNVQDVCKNYNSGKHHADIDQNTDQEIKKQCNKITKAEKELRKEQTRMQEGHK